VAKWDKLGHWKVHEGNRGEGSGKWEVGSGKWEVGSGKWEVGSGTGGGCVGASGAVSLSV
jgi:hypothetical protein